MFQQKINKIVMLIISKQKAKICMAFQNKFLNKYTIIYIKLNYKIISIIIIIL